MERIPFLRFLIPLISGILFCKYVSPSFNPLIIGLIGLLVALISFFIPEKYDYSLRWLFGAGVLLFLFSTSILFFQFHERLVAYDFPQEKKLYVGEVVDFPEQKKRSVACEIDLVAPLKKKVMLYLETDSNSLYLKPGDQIIFRGQIKSFKNLGNPNEFDYKSFMHNRRFSGTSYINAANWFQTGFNNQSLKSRALRLRAEMLKVYKSFDIDSNAYSFISAITLGYKTDLPEDIKNAFRSSGTSHILALSGLHVGIVYIAIISMFSFLGKRRRSFIIKQILVLLTLWGYVYITGMSVSVIRATIMLSIVCIGSIFNRRGFNYNTLAVAAFFILIINPFYLFDVGFQLSFLAVFSILYFHPKLSKLYEPKYRATKYIWNIFTVSLAAQIGVFPLILYYFGTFPTYFFVTNLLVLPFIGLIIYAVIALSVLSFLSIRGLKVVGFISHILITCVQFLVRAVLEIVYFVNSLPMSVFKEVDISIFQLFLIFGIVFLLYQFVEYKKAKQLIFLLLFVVLLLMSNCLPYIRSNNNFTIYNSYDKSEMAYKIDGRKIKSVLKSNQPILHPSASIVLLKENIYSLKLASNPIPLDYLILASDNSFSVVELINFYQPKKIIFDSSISSYAAKKLKEECEELGIPFHDISNSGAYSIKF